MIYSKSQTTVEGLDELIKAFEKLPGEMANQYLRDATNKLAASLYDAVLSNTPQGETGNLRKGIKLSKAGKPRSNYFRVVASVKSTAPHTALVEFGHKLVKGGKLGAGGKVVGKVEGHPFIRPVGDRYRETAVEYIANGLELALKNMGGKK